MTGPAKFACISALMAGATILGADLAIPAQAQSTVTTPDAGGHDGTYAGTFICASGEMGMSLTLKDQGPATEFIHRGVCRSGSGPCNDKYDQELAKSRAVNGVINFFPTAGNPSAPSGAFHVRGTTTYALKSLTRLHLAPEHWIDRPDEFGASGLEASITKGKISGKPTAPGCYTLKLRKLKTQ